jgi:hypothetical protein
MMIWEEWNDILQLGSLTGQIPTLDALAYYTLTSHNCIHSQSLLAPVSRVSCFEITVEYCNAIEFWCHSSPNIAVVYQLHPANRNKTAAGLCTSLYTYIRRNPKHPLHLLSAIKCYNHNPSNDVTRGGYVCYKVYCYVLCSVLETCEGVSVVVTVCIRNWGMEGFNFCRGGWQDFSWFSSIQSSSTCQHNSYSTNGLCPPHSGTLNILWWFCLFFSGGDVVWKWALLPSYRRYVLRAFLGHKMVDCVLCALDNTLASAVVWGLLQYIKWSTTIYCFFMLT